MTTGVHASFQIRVFFGYRSKSEIAGSYGSFIFILGTSILFSIVAIPIYIPVNSLEGSLFSASSLAFIICRFFDDSHSEWCEVIPQSGFKKNFFY